MVVELLNLTTESLVQGSVKKSGVAMAVSATLLPMPIIHHTYAKNAIIQFNSYGFQDLQLSLNYDR